MADLNDKMDLIIDLLERKIMPSMQDLKDSVTRNTSAEQSIVTLLNGISQQLKDAQASSDPQAIQDVITQIDANSKALSDAVTANTSAAPPVTPAS